MYIRVLVPVLLLLVLVVFVARSSLVDTSHPVLIVQTSKGDHVVKLTGMMREALHRKYPGFVPWAEADFLPDIVRTYLFRPHEAPFAIISDFNQDGTADVALSGHDDGEALLLALLSRGHSYDVVTLESGRAAGSRAENHDGESGLITYLAGVPDGRLETLDGAALDIRGNAFEEVFYGKGSTAYVYEHGAFKEHLTGD